DRQQQDREDRDGVELAPAAEQDADADAQEAGHQQEVREEADVADFGGDPPDEQQLDEEERTAGEDEAGTVPAQAIDSAGPRDRSRPGAGRHHGNGIRAPGMKRPGAEGRSRAPGL